MKGKGALIVERRCAETLLRVLGCVNVEHWEDEVFVKRLKNVDKIYEEGLDVGEFKELLDALLVADPDSILLRYSDRFKRCIKNVKNLSALKDVEIIGRRVLRTKKRVRGERFSFAACGIPVGATLVLKRDPTVTCRVIGDPWIVDFGDDDEYFDEKFSMRTKRLLGAKESTYLSPMHYWMYNGELLRNYYKRIQRAGKGDEGAIDEGIMDEGIMDEGIMDEAVMDEYVETDESTNDTIDDALDIY